MKKVLLATSKNSLYRAPLEAGGYAVSEFPLTAGPAALDEVRRLPLHDFVLADAAGCTGETCGLYRALREKGRLICVADGMRKELKERLLDCGISDLLVKSEPASLVPLLPVIGEERAGDAGSFIILDDENPAREVLGAITARFNYSTVLISTTDELFDGVIGPGVRFILVNLGTRALDLNGLVRKFYASVPARGIPVLAYKDMREGMFVHEFVGGLNRLTRYILGLDELYGLLVDLLFRREVVPLVARLNRESQADANTAFNADTLNQVFYMCEKRLFEGTDLLGDDALSSMAQTLRALERAVRNVETLKWLKTGIDQNSISTAGTGG